MLLFVEKYKYINPINTINITNSKVIIPRSFSKLNDTLPCCFVLIDFFFFFLDGLLCLFSLKLRVLTFFFSQNPAEWAQSIWSSLNTVTSVGCQMGFNGYGRIWTAGLILFLMPFTSLCKHRKALFLMRNTHRSLCVVSVCVHWRKKHTLIHWSDRMPGKHFTLPLNLTLNTMFYFIAMSLRDGQARNGTLRTGFVLCALCVR